ncbi:MAG: MBL fold metallo-hydrolase [Myxococcales bacterium]|nr:MBL fold metallo-hydrolase [Myxococcales bacterium]
MQADTTSLGPRLSFCGAAGTVTGSKYLIEWAGQHLLLDCGLFQGLKDLRLRNWGEPPFEPRRLDAIVLSHAHIDHSGYLPLLVRRGYRGPVYCTRATAALLRILLTDSARLMEEEAEYANRHQYSKHHPALPLYSAEDVEQVFPLLQPQDYAQSFAVLPGLSATLRRTGHILGSASVDLLWEGLGKRLIFSGDLGRWGRPILRDPEPVPQGDVLLIESTYGDRCHRSDAPAQLARVISETAHRGGAVLIPAFAVGRVQELLWTLGQLEDRGEVPLISVYVDSPMAIDVTELTLRFPEEHDEAMDAALRNGSCPLHSREYHAMRTVEQSKWLNGRKGPMVIIAGNGMMTGGRILHHLRQRLDDPRNTILLVGYQAAGTRGRALLEGATQLRMHGQMVPVRAQVEVIDGLSAHADQSELMRWLSGFKTPPQKTYIVHGEPGPAQTLASLLKERLGWSAAVAVDGETIPLFDAEDGKANGIST